MTWMKHLLDPKESRQRQLLKTPKYDTYCSLLPQTFTMMPPSGQFFIHHHYYGLKTNFGLLSISQCDSLYNEQYSLTEYIYHDCTICSVLFKGENSWVFYFKLALWTSLVLSFPFSDSLTLFYVFSCSRKALFSVPSVLLCSNGALIKVKQKGEDRAQHTIQRIDSATLCVCVRACVCVCVCVCVCTCCSLTTTRMADWDSLCFLFMQSASFIIIIVIIISFMYTELFSVMLWSASLGRKACNRVNKKPK